MQVVGFSSLTVYIESYIQIYFSFGYLHFFIARGEREDKGKRN